MALEEYKDDDIDDSSENWNGKVVAVPLKYPFGILLIPFGLPWCWPHCSNILRLAPILLTAIYCPYRFEEFAAVERGGAWPLAYKLLLASNLSVIS